MVRRACFSLAFGVLTATVSAAFAPAPVYREPPKPKAPDVYALMQGTWEVHQNVDNNVIRLKGIKRIQQRIRIEGNVWEYMASDNGVVATLSAKNRIVLDPKASPATLDLVQLGFRAEYTTMKGIVRVEGDMLTFCYVYAQERNAERPKQFVVRSQFQPIQPKDARMMTLKRVK
jgi:uncharacterized protein (TIGR03067 family)